MAKEPKFGQVSILDISYEKGNGALGITQTYHGICTNLDLSQQQVLLWVQFLLNPSPH